MSITTFEKLQETPKSQKTVLVEIETSIEPTSAGWTLSAGAVIIAMDMINLWVGLDNEVITVNPVSILCTPRLGYTARWLMGMSSSFIWLRIMFICLWNQMGTCLPKLSQRKSNNIQTTPFWKNSHL